MKILTVVMFLGLLSSCAMRPKVYQTERHVSAQSFESIYSGRSAAMPIGLPKGAGSGKRMIAAGKRKSDGKAYFYVSVYVVNLLADEMYSTTYTADWLSIREKLRNELKLWEKQQAKLKGIVNRMLNQEQNGPAGTGQ